eukprot:gene6565-13287_t
MGNLLNRKVVFVQPTKNDKKPIKVDERRRNSLAFFIARYLKYDGVDFNALVVEIKREIDAQKPNGRATVRDKKYSQIAEAVAQGSMKEIKNQVIYNFKKINRNYKEPWNGNSLTHIICTEGFLDMLTFILDKSKHSEWDHVDLNLRNKNDRDRVPFFLCFTPPTATYTGLTNGVNIQGEVISIRPDGIEIIADWIQPGNQLEREGIIQLLIEAGQDVNIKDFHNFTGLHYACMWGWENTVKLLLENGADINSQTINGKTPLMYAVEFLHTHLVHYLIEQEDIHINSSDVDGNSPLIIATEMNTFGFDIAVLLIKKGADVNHETLRKKTPLMIACTKSWVVFVSADRSGLGSDSLENTER